MKKPTKPRKPTKPTTPVQNHYSNVSLHTVCAHDTVCLKDVKLPEGVKYSDLIITHESDCDYGDESYSTVNIEYQKTFPNQDYAQDVTKFNTKMKQYNADMANHKVKMTKYNADLKKFEDAQNKIDAKSEISKLEMRLEELKKYQ